MSVPFAAPAPSPRWLVEWAVDQPLVIEQAAVAAALTAAENAAAPADPRFVGIELDRMLELYGTPANWAAIADEYLEVFEDVPPDLVQLAFKRMRRSPRDYLPKPGQLLALILDDLNDRKHMLFKVRLALTRRRDQEPERPPPSQADKDAVDELVARATHRTPKGRDDQGRPMSRGDQQRVAAETAGYRLPDPDDPGVLARLREMEGGSS